MTDDQSLIRSLIVRAEARTALALLDLEKQRRVVNALRETIAAGDRVVVTFSVHRWIHADVTEPWQWSLDRQREYLTTDCGSVYRKDGAMWWLDRTGRARDRATVTSVEKVSGRFTTHCPGMAGDRSCILGRGHDGEHKALAELLAMGVTLGEVE